MNRATIVTGILLFILSFGANAQWQPLVDQDNLLIERFAHPTATQELRLTTTMTAPMATIIDVLNDVKHYPDFLPHFQWVELLAQDGDESLVYFLLDPPVIDHRDYTLQIRNRLSQDGQQFERYFINANELGPKPNRGIVRVESVEGSWHLTQLTPQQTKVVHWVKTTPAGELPDFLVSWANKRGLSLVVEAVRQRATSQ